MKIGKKGHTCIKQNESLNEHEVTIDWNLFDYWVFSMNQGVRELCLMIN
jgi:hypothetical protein